MILTKIWVIDLKHFLKNIALSITDKVEYDERDLQFSYILTMISPLRREFTKENPIPYDYGGRLSRADLITSEGVVPFLRFFYSTRWWFANVDDDF